MHGCVGVGVCVMLWVAQRKHCSAQALLSTMITQHDSCSARWLLSIMYVMLCVMVCSLYDVVCDAVCGVVFGVVCGVVCDVVCGVMYDDIDGDGVVSKVERLIFNSST